MMLGNWSNWSTDELIRLVAAGGGVRVSATRISAPDLVLVAAAMIERSRLIITGCGRLSVDEAVEIAAASVGVVLFDD